MSVALGAFRYVAIDAAGKTDKGTVDGGSARHAREVLRERGLTPVAVEPVAPSGLKGRAAVRLTSGEFALFARLVGGLLEAGLELEAALRSTAAQSSNRTKGWYEAVLGAVLQGKNLSQSLATVGRVSELATAAIEAGERSGQLAPVLLALADHAERRSQLRSQILVALLYPIILTLVSVLVAVLLITYVVPEVTRVFEGYDRDLPELTQWLIALSGWLRNYAFELAFGASALVCGAAMAARTERGAEAIDHVLNRLPGVGAVRRAVDRERFADTLAMLLGGGVPLIEALRSAAAVLATGALREQAQAVASAVERGQPVADAMAESQLLSGITIQLVAAGEESSRLESMLERAAKLEGDQLKQRLDVAIGLAEPLLVLLMGGVVLLIVLAILLPIFELNTLIA